MHVNGYTLGRELIFTIFPLSIERDYRNKEEGIFCWNQVSVGIVQIYYVRYYVRYIKSVYKSRIRIGVKSAVFY